MIPCEVVLNSKLHRNGREMGAWENILLIQKLAWPEAFFQLAKYVWGLLLPTPKMWHEYSRSPLRFCASWWL